MSSSILAYLYTITVAHPKDILGLNEITINEIYVPSIRCCANDVGGTFRSDIPRNNKFQKIKISKDYLNVIQEEVLFKEAIAENTKKDTFFYETI